MRTAWHLADATYEMLLWIGYMVSYEVCLTGWQSELLGVGFQDDTNTCKI